ncbi:hypothetical protein T4B_12488 [Trichinella pseudospiralis]|uniref:Uncharacterized protein n=1 Tax=Trichinella pseudospiralis TaxID=6337 RepID=A0A0V1DNY8_TRIPS|nr:hypothetical protein T4A_11942 [Trichinella pseudospiralis]KRY63279.1 hypothetical protein T4A_6714 [Trichinella pseudospiralis]KRY94226.1 hypothetical protein T4B_12488 [Trichinella pseudospiralis]
MAPECSFLEKRKTTEGGNTLIGFSILFRID